MTKESTQTNIPEKIIFLNDHHIYKALKNYIINEVKLDIDQIVERIINSAVQRIVDENDTSKLIHEVINKKLFPNKFIGNKVIRDGVKNALDEKIEIIIRTKD